MATSSEDWKDVNDGRRRKQIQNRLAQRRHRQKRKNSQVVVPAQHAAVHFNACETQETPPLGQRSPSRTPTRDQASSLIGLIEWQSPGSRCGSTTAVPINGEASTRGDSIIPDLDTDSLHLPLGGPDPVRMEDVTSSTTVSCPNDATAWSSYLANVSSGWQSLCHMTMAEQQSRQDTPDRSAGGLSSSSPSEGTDAQRFGRCLQMLHSAGFPTVDAFVTRYYTTRFERSSTMETIQRRSCVSNLGPLITSLQNVMSQWPYREAQALHDGFARASVSPYLDEIRKLPKMPRDQQGTSQAREQIPKLWSLFCELASEAGCPSPAMDTTVQTIVDVLMISNGVGLE